MTTTYFVGTALEYMQHRHRDPLAILCQRPDRLTGVNPDRIVWGDTADQLDNIDALRAAARPVVQNVTPTEAATSPDDLTKGLASMTKPELVALLDHEDLNTAGTKAELIDRWTAHHHLDPDDVEVTTEIAVETIDEDDEGGELD